MKFRIGDKVKFLNDVGGGVITGFVNNNMAEVESDDGFGMPVPVSELVNDNAGAYGFGGEEPEEPQIVETNRGEVETVTNLKPEDFSYREFIGEAFLAIVPDNDRMLHVSDFELYLVNDCSYSINYIITKREKNLDEFVKHGILQPDSKLKIAKFNQSGLSKIDAFILQGIFYKEGLFDKQKPIEVLNNIKDFSFYKANIFDTNDYFKSKALLFKKEELDMASAVEQLSKNDILKVSVSKEATNKPAYKKVEQKPNTGLEEIDLHIEAIVDDFKDLSNGEIVEIQMGRFETALETAIRSKTTKIVFIHGVGGGTLKHELRSKLDRKYPDLKYQDASFKEYGYGATMVNLK